MNSEKIGNLILQLRKEKGFTQKELAGKLFVSDKAVSKWERGVGCPDISLISALSKVFAVDIKDLLEGEKSQSEKVHGDLRKCQFFFCESCGNVITSFSSCSLSCCGVLLNPLLPKYEEEHLCTIEHMEDFYYISSNHEMRKEHYITFIALVRDGSIWLNKLYPEQMAETAFPDSVKGGFLYIHCKKHGLFQQRFCVS